MKSKLRYIGLVITMLASVLVLSNTERSVKAESPYNSRPMVLELLELYADYVQNGGRTDETYLLAGGRRIWKKDSDPNQRHYLDSIPPLVFLNYIELALKEGDWGSPDDLLGRVRVYGESYEWEIGHNKRGLELTFDRGSAQYILVYRVRPATKEESGATLRPSHASGKCLDAPWEQIRVSGANLQQWDCGADRVYVTQRFRLKPAGSGYFTITGTFSNGHLCLDVEGNSTANGAPVQQSNCHGQDNQLWKLVDMGNGKFQIVSKRSNKCLDVAWDNERYAHSNGARIQQWTCYGPDQLNQLWKIVQP